MCQQCTKGFIYGLWHNSCIYKRPTPCENYPSQCLCSPLSSQSLPLLLATSRFLSFCSFMCAAFKNVPLTVLRQSWSNSNDKCRVVAKISANCLPCCPYHSTPSTKHPQQTSMLTQEPHNNEAYVALIKWPRRQSNSPYSSFTSVRCSCSVSTTKPSSFLLLGSSHPLASSLLPWPHSCSCAICLSLFHQQVDQRFVYTVASSPRVKAPVYSLNQDWEVWLGKAELGEDLGEDGRPVYNALSSSSWVNISVCRLYCM